MNIEYTSEHGHRLGKGVLRGTGIFLAQESISKTTDILVEKELPNEVLE